jgi:hypothetical protein
MAICSLRRYKEGEVVSVIVDPDGPDAFALIDVLDDGNPRKKLVTQRYQEENHICEGKMMTWNEWIVPVFNPFLNWLFNPVQDVTNAWADINAEFAKKEDELKDVWNSDI